MASGDAIFGVIEIPAKTVPPWNGKGAFKTREKAEVCCGQFIGAADLGLAGDSNCNRVCNFNVRRYVKGVVRQAGTGVIINQTSRLDLLYAFNNIVLPVTYPDCSYGMQSNDGSLGFLPPGICPAPTADIYIGISGYRQVVGADTFSSVFLSISSLATIFVNYTGASAVTGWTLAGGASGTGGSGASKNICGTNDLFRTPTKVHSCTRVPGGGSCTSVDMELWIEPA